MPCYSCLPAAIVPFDRNSGRYLYTMLKKKLKLIDNCLLSPRSHGDEINWIGKDFFRVFYELFSSCCIVIRCGIELWDKQACCIHPPILSLWLIKEEERPKNQQQQQPGFPCSWQTCSTVQYQVMNNSLLASSSWSVFCSLEKPRDLNRHETYALHTLYVVFSLG